MFDRGQVVLDLLIVRRGARPVANGRVLPCLMRQIRHLRRLQAEAGDVEQEEVVQGIGADRRLGGLQPAVGAGGDQFGRNLGVEDGLQDIGRAACVLLHRHPADQVPDQGLRHAAVDIVVAHMVADAIGGPAQRQLRQVAGAQHKGAVLVGQPEQIVGAQPRLDVLEGDVVHRLALGERMADGLEHGLRGRPDVDLGPGHTQRLHQRPGVGLGPLRGGEAGHRIGENAGPRQAQPVEGAAGDQQGLGRIQPARDADHQLFGAGRLHPAHQPLHLDVEGLVAVLIQPGRVVRHEGEAVEGADQLPDGTSDVRVANRDFDKITWLHLPSRAVGEGAVALAFQPDTLDVDVGDGQVALHREPLALGQLGTQFVDRGLSVPGEVGSAFPPARGGKDVGGHRPRRLAGRQHRPVVGLADHHIGRRKVQEDAGPGERLAGRGWKWSPVVLADLHPEDETRPALDAEDQIGTEAGAVTGHIAAAAGIQLGRGGGEPALLIVLPIVGQVGLGNDTPEPAVGHDHGRVVEALLVPHGGTDDGDDANVLRRLGHPRDLPLHLIQQRLLHQQVVDGVAAEAQLRKDDQVHALGRRRCDQADVLIGIGHRVGRVHHRGGGGHTDEAVGAWAEEGVIGRHQCLPLIPAKAGTQ